MARAPRRGAHGAYGALIRVIRACERGRPPGSERARWVLGDCPIFVEERWSRAQRTVEQSHLKLVRTARRKPVR